MKPIVIYVLATVLVAALSPLRSEASEAATKHPCLFFRANELEGLRKKFNDPRYADYKSIILAEAGEIMTYNGEGKGGKELDFKHRAYALIGKKQPVLNILPWAYCLTGDKAYKEMFLAVMQYDFDRINKGELIFDPQKFSSEFTMVQFAVHAAAAYDLLYPELTPAQRESFEKYLDQSLALYRNRVKASYGWGNNIGAIYFSASAIVAMSRLHDNPDAPAILDECLAKMKEVFYKASIIAHEDGGYSEGPLYRNFAMLWNLAFVDTYERVTGRKDHGLLDPPFFKNSYRYVETMMGGNGTWMTFNDSQPQWYGAPSCAWLGARYDQPFMRWMADYLVANYNREPASERSRGLQPTYWVMTFLWRDDKPAPKNFPGLPTLSILPSLNTGAMRSEGTLTPGLMVGVRGRGPNETGHSQADAGSFVLYANGENFLIDPGYFHPDSIDHSMPVVDGTVPVLKDRLESPLSGSEKGGLRQLSVDASAVYKQTVRRTFAMPGNQAVVVLDEIGGSEVVSALQLGFKAELLPDKCSAIVRGNNSSLLIGASGPSFSLELEGPLDFGKSWIYKKLADAGKMDWHRLKCRYHVDPETPLVWIFMPLAKGQQPGHWEVKRSPGLIEVRLPGGQELKFIHANGQWKLND